MPCFLFQLCTLARPSFLFSQITSPCPDPPTHGSVHRCHRRCPLLSICAAAAAAAAAAAPLLLLLLQRFYRLVSDRRLWLVVSPTGRAPESAPGGAGPVYTTLQAAVQASRPGDTIWLSPGFTHSAADVTIPWPLHLLGGGTHPTDTLVSAPLNADCALSFTAR